MNTIPEDAIAAAISDAIRMVEDEPSYRTDDDEGDIPPLPEVLRQNPSVRLCRKHMSEHGHLDNLPPHHQYRANVDIIHSHCQNAAEILEYFLWYTRSHGQVDETGQGRVPLPPLPPSCPPGHYRRTILIALKARGASFDVRGGDGKRATDFLDGDEYVDIIKAVEQTEQMGRWELAGYY